MSEFSQGIEDRLTRLCKYGIHHSYFNIEDRLTRSSKYGIQGIEDRLTRSSKYGIHHSYFIISFFSIRLKIM